MMVILNVRYAIADEQEKHYEGNILTEEDQWRKLRLIKEIVEERWG